MTVEQMWCLTGVTRDVSVGANDVDNISAVDPGLLGTRRSPLEEIRTNIKAAALEPVERDGLFLPMRQP